MLIRKYLSPDARRIQLLPAATFMHGEHSAAEIARMGGRQRRLLAAIHEADFRARRAARAWLYTGSRLRGGRSHPLMLALLQNFRRERERLRRIRDMPRRRWDPKVIAMPDTFSGRSPKPTDFDLPVGTRLPDGMVVCANRRMARRVLERCGLGGGYARLDRTPHLWLPESPGCLHFDFYAVDPDWDTDPREREAIFAAWLAEPEQTFAAWLAEPA